MRFCVILRAVFGSYVLAEFSDRPSADDYLSRLRPDLRASSSVSVRK